MKNSLWFLAALEACVAFAPGAEQIPLSRLNLNLVDEAGSSHLSRPRPGLSVGGHPTKVGGRPFTDGFGTRGSSRWVNGVAVWKAGRPARRIKGATPLGYSEGPGRYLQFQADPGRWSFVALRVKK